MWIYFLIIAGVFGHPVQDEKETDGESSRKILGSSVVTSVSVIMDTGNGTKAIFSDAVGKPVNRPIMGSELASPINLLNPDRYEFYTFDDSGELVKRLMTLDEIQGIVATGDSDGFGLDSMSSMEYFPEKRVNDIVNNVQNVLKEEIELHKDHVEKPLYDTPDVSDNWSMILPAVFGNSGESITPEKPIMHVTPDTIMLEPTRKPASTRKTTTTRRPLISSTIINNVLYTSPKYTTSAISGTTSTTKATPSTTTTPKRQPISSTVINNIVYSSPKSTTARSTTARSTTAQSTTAQSTTEEVSNIVTPFGSTESNEKFVSTSQNSILYKEKPVLNVEIISNSKSTTEKSNVQGSNNLHVVEIKPPLELTKENSRPIYHMSSKPIATSTRKTPIVSSTTRKQTITYSSPNQPMITTYRPSEPMFTPTKPSAPTVTHSSAIETSYKPIVTSSKPIVTYYKPSIIFTSSKPSTTISTSANPHNIISTSSKPVVTTSTFVIPSTTGQIESFKNKIPSLSQKVNIPAETLINKETTVLPSTTENSVGITTFTSITSNKDDTASQLETNVQIDESTIKQDNLVDLNTAATNYIRISTESNIKEVSSEVLLPDLSTAANSYSSPAFNKISTENTKNIDTTLYPIKLTTADRKSATEILDQLVLSSTNINQINELYQNTEHLPESIDNIETTEYQLTIEKVNEATLGKVTETATKLPVTTSVPTTSVPTTSVPTTSVPTTSVPTSSVPTTSVPTTSVPTTNIPETTTYLVQTDNSLIGSIDQLLMQAVGNIEETIISNGIAEQTVQNALNITGKKNMSEIVQQTATLASSLTVESSTPRTEITTKLDDNYSDLAFKDTNLLSDSVESILSMVYGTDNPVYSTVNDLTTTEDLTTMGAKTILPSITTENSTDFKKMSKNEDKVETTTYMDTQERRTTDNIDTNNHIINITIIRSDTSNISEIIDTGASEYLTTTYLNNKIETTTEQEFTTFFTRPEVTSKLTDKIADLTEVYYKIPNLNFPTTPKETETTSFNSRFQEITTDFPDLTTEKTNNEEVQPTINIIINETSMVTELPLMDSNQTTTQDYEPSTRELDMKRETTTFQEVIEGLMTTLPTHQKDSALEVTSEKLLTTAQNVEKTKPEAIKSDIDTEEDQIKRVPEESAQITAKPLNNKIVISIGDTILEKENNSTWTLVPTVVPHKNIQTTVKVETNQPIATVTEPLPPVDLVPKPFQGFGLEDSTSKLDTDIYQFTHLCNELAFGFWKSVTNEVSSARSVFVSPFAATSLLAMVFLGARGATSGEMNEILKLDDMVTFNPHLIFKNITESIETSPDSGIATNAIIRELYSDRSKGKLLGFYKERARAFYDGYVEEAGFKRIGDVIRRRTNLLVRRYTNEKINEFLKDGSVSVNSPLAGLGVNIFYTDCSQASTEGRDGELHFVVLPSVRQRRLVPVPAVVFRTGFLAGYEPSLDATAVSLGTKDQVVSTIFIIPGQQGIAAPGDGLTRLEKRLVDSAFKQGAWSRLLRALIPRPGLEVQLPRFLHRSVINATLALRKMGLKDLFDPDKADLRGLNGVPQELHLSSMLQINEFATCGENRIGESHHSEIYPASANRPRNSRNRDLVSEFMEEPRDYQRAFHDPLHNPSYFALPLALRPRQARIPDSPRLRFDRPFLYIVRHNPTGLILHMGRFNPRLLP